jgi:hypothetical protein
MTKGTTFKRLWSFCVIFIGVFFISASLFIALWMFIGFVVYRQTRDIDSVGVVCGLSSVVLLLTGTSFVLVPMLSQLKEMTPIDLLEGSCRLIQCGFGLLCIGLCLPLATFVNELRKPALPGFTIEETAFLTMCRPDARFIIQSELFLFLIPGLIVLGLGVFWLVICRKRMRYGAIQSARATRPEVVRPLAQQSGERQGIRPADPRTTTDPARIDPSREER